MVNYETYDGQAILGEASGSVSDGFALDTERLDRRRGDDYVWQIQALQDSRKRLEIQTRTKRKTSEEREIIKMILGLPCEPLHRLAGLPNASGIYFIMRGFECLYIGMAMRLKQRLCYQIHEPRRYLGPIKEEIAVGYLVVRGAQAAIQAKEAGFIKLLTPVYNKVHNSIWKEWADRESEGKWQIGNLKP